MLIVVLSLTIQIPFALGLALMLNRRFRGRTLFRLLFFAPYVLSEVITGDRLPADPLPEGLVDRRLDGVGLGGLTQDWLADRRS